MKHILAITIILTTLSFSSQEKKCSDIKNGKFKYFDSSANEIIVIRKDSIQIDSSTTSKLTYHSKIKWLNDCKYDMTFFKVNNPEMKLLIGTTFEFEVLDIVVNKIKLKTKTVNKERESEHIMEIIE